MICPVCNQNIPDGSNYCPSCAADLTKYRRQIMTGRQQPPKRPQQPDPRMMPPQQGGTMPQQFTGKYPPLPPQQDPMRPPQYAGQQVPPPLYGEERNGEGSLLEGITPRGKLFFGIGGLVLVGVLVLLVVNLFGGGGAAQPTSPPVPTESPKPYGFDFDVFDTPEPDEYEDDPYQNLYVAPTAQPATPMPEFGLLKKGVKGMEADVIRLQERLQLLGYLPPDALIDGDYGAATANAVKEFQRSSGLPADGDAGPITQTKLFSIPIDTGEPQPGVEEDGELNQPG